MDTTKPDCRCERTTCGCATAATTTPPPRCTCGETCACKATCRCGNGCACGTRAS